MKKLLLSIALVVSAGTLSAGIHLFKVRNWTPNEIQFKTTWGGAGICAPKQDLVRSGGAYEEKTDCCLRKIMVRQTTGNNRKWYEGSPKRTGFGISCTKNVFQVRRARDGSLNIKRTDK